MNNSFSILGISEPILTALEKMGFESPTEVQKKAIPHVLQQKDVIVVSKTGTGKTAVFGVPMLQLIDPDTKRPEGLILTPTRELAVQVDSDIKRMSSHLPHKTTAIYGQHDMNKEIQELTRGVSIVTGTPGRVYDHIRQGNLITKQVRFLVLDEADRMLDMGFIDQVEQIVRTVPRDRVTLLFSATMPDEIRRICRKHMKNPVTIEFQSQAKTVEAIQQVYYRVNDNEKNMQLNRLLLKEQPESCLIFCNTRIAVERVQRFLWRKGYLCYALHGDIPQNKRTITLRRFKRGAFHIMIATDVAARGIHIDELSLVINYDVPLEKDGYVHRIGRTGRAGNQGRAITLVTSDDIMDLYEIEEHIGTMIPEGELPSEAEFNQYRAKATEWIERNSLKEQASNSTPKQGSKQKTNKSSDRYLQSGRRSKDSSKETYNKSKTGAGQTNRRPYAAPVEKDLRSNSPSPLTSANLETVPSSSDPISTNADNKTPAATKKKSWLKQLWQNIIKDQAKA